MFGDPIENPKNYPTVPFRSLMSIGASQDSSTTCWLLDLEEIESNTGRILKRKTVSKESISQSTVPFEKGWVLYSKLRPYLNKVVIADADGYASSELISLKVEPKFNATYISCLLRFPSFVSWINGLAAGTKMPRAPMNSLRQFGLIKPEYSEQLVFVEEAAKIDKLKFGQSATRGRVISYA